MFGLRCRQFPKLLFAAWAPNRSVLTAQRFEISAREAIGWFDSPLLNRRFVHATGLLVPHGDHASFAEAIDRLLTDENKRQIMGAKARAWGLKFDWDASANKCMTILEQVVNGHKS